MVCVCVCVCVRACVRACVCERVQYVEKDLFELVCSIQTVIIILLDQVYCKSFHITLINTYAYEN